MCRWFIPLIPLVLVLSPINVVRADPVYSPGLLMRCDAQGAPGGLGEEGVLQTDWVRVSEYWNLNVNSTGINVHIVAGLAGAIEGRDNAEETLPGPLFDVERDFLFGNDTNIRPDNDLILTLSNLRAGFYRVFSYNNRPDEHPTPISSVVVTGAASVVSVPEWIMQDHTIMTIPVQILFESSGGDDVEIRYWGPSTSGVGSMPGTHSGQAYINGFTLEYFGASNEAAYDPSPANKTEDLCTGFDISWTPGTSANSHEVYFSSDINDVDPNQSPSPVDTVVGSAGWTPPALEPGTTYYWRVDEVTFTRTWQGAIWRFTTNDGNAFDGVPADGWRGLSTETDLSWSPGCDANSHNVYFGTSESDVTTGGGGTFQGNQEETTFDPGSLSANTDYYWRVEEVNEAEAATWPGEVWTFKTGTGVEGSLMYYKFDDGPLGSPLDNSVPDSTGNETFTKYVDPCEPGSALVYGASNPVINAAGGYSADFLRAGLYRDGAGAGDPLVLDGYQYTVECWINPDVLVDPVGGLDIRDHGVTLVGRVGPIEDEDEAGENDWWGLELSLPAGAIFVHRGREFRRDNMFVYSGRNTIMVGEWHHVAGVFDLSDPGASMKIYVDGQLKASALRPAANPPDANSLPISMGFRRIDTGGRAGDYFEGMIDEVRISNYALEPAEFLLVPGPEWARSPNPSNGERRVDPNVVLSWVPGSKTQDVDGHDVYFGTDYDDVFSATSSDTEFVDSVDVNGFDPLGPVALEFGTRYYWRIDEVNDAEPNIWKGVVWSFTVQSEVDDPNMILWYKFDEMSGNEAFDSSGHDYFGDIDGPDEGPNWDPYDGEGGSLVFDNDTAVSVPGAMLGNVLDGVSIAVWLKDADNGGDNWLFDSTSAGDIDMQLAVPDENGVVYWRVGNDSNDVLTWDMGRAGFNPATLEGWHHWAFIKGEGVPEMTIYFDGEVVESNDVTDNTLTLLRDTPSRIGTQGDSDSVFEGKVDDFMVFDYALSESEVQELFRRGDLERAWAPDPRNGQMEVSRNAQLSWRPGDTATGHDVYLGSDFDDVNDTDTLGSAYKPPRLALGTETYNPGGLELDTTYYWRIDEVNGLDIWKGRVWSFTVADYLVVDDMESYDAVPSSGNEIYDTWDDGFSNWTGSQLALEYGTNSTLHGGAQSMKFGYNNAIAYYKYSEIDANTTGPRPGNLDIGKDWTEAGVRALTIFFHGSADNDVTEQMYAALSDNSNNMAVSKYGDMGEDMNDVNEPDWHQWEIPLTAFSDGGVDLTDVNKVRIGFGDRDNPVVGGSGLVFLDDIRLHLPKCVPWLAKPAFDFSSNCIVDLADVAIMAEDWLLSDIDLGAVTAPSAPVLHYAFEDVSGSSVTDSEGGYTGTFFTDLTTAPAEISPRVEAGGKSGNSFHFSSPLGYAGIKMPSTVFTDNGISQEITISVWIKNAHPDEEPDGDAFMWEFRQWDGVSPDANERVLAVETDSDGDTYVFHDQNESVSYEMDWERHTGWKHYAFVRDADNLAIYANGVLEDISDSNGTVLATPQLLYLGISADLSPASTEDMHDGFTGNVDEWKIFDYALSSAEVGYIASEGTGVVLMDSAYNIYDTESAGSRAINFRDYALLLESWLEKTYWP